ncbi:HNH endonuclease family protein [Arthrobacter cryoconiti]|uniref:HNH endonuclease family protein n=1 Tax=Arthrobacter cryoconiti TaxID=748907 RepID=A0ABV8R1J2_9MICC|nr:HNH endonuclease family protein [Arthrobacter cryoconiti]MCC9069878.1 HNH endonuclease family protein [Arthrobacter cryoconiti]
MGGHAVNETGSVKGRTANFHRDRAAQKNTAGPSSTANPMRKLLMAAAALFVLLLIAVAGWLHASGRWPFEPDAGPPPTVTTPVPGLGQPVFRVGTATALAALATLPVKGRAPATGYERSVFGEAWLDVDTNGCDTRNDILRRDLKELRYVIGSLCLIQGGTMHEPYTGHDLTFTRGGQSSAALQIDHVVALGNAWVTGAQKLTEIQRQSLANDPLNLLAVDGPANQEKSDADAATWLPPNKSFRCRYVARQISVKVAYQLWVTKDEHDAMERILSACPEEKILASGYAP